MIYKRMKRKGVDNKTNIRVCLETPLIFVQKKVGDSTSKILHLKCYFLGLLEAIFAYSTILITIPYLKRKCYQ